MDEAKIADLSWYMSSPTFDHDLDVACAIEYFDEHSHPLNAAAVRLLLQERDDLRRQAAEGWTIATTYGEQAETARTARDQALKDRDEARAKIAAKVRRQADLEHEYRDGTNYYSYGWQDAAAWIEGGFDHGTLIGAEFSRATSPAARSTLDSLLQLRTAAEKARKLRDAGFDENSIARDLAYAAALEDVWAAVDALTQEDRDGR